MQPRTVNKIVMTEKVVMQPKVTIEKVPVTKQVQKSRIVYQPKDTIRMKEVREVQRTPYTVHVPVTV